MTTASGGFPRMPRGPRPRAVLLAVGTLVVLAAITQATTSWSSVGTLNVTVDEPPAVFAAGTGPSNHRYVKSFDLSPDATSFSLEMKAKAGKAIAITDMARLSTTDAAPLSVTLTGEPVSNVLLTQVEWRIYDGATLVGTLDHRSGDPRVTVTVPASSALSMDLHVTLLSGAGRNNVPDVFDVALEVP